MKKILVSLVAAFAVVSLSYAHCGSCNSGCDASAAKSSLANADASCEAKGAAIAKSSCAKADTSCEAKGVTLAKSSCAKADASCEAKGVTLAKSSCAKADASCEAKGVTLAKSSCAKADAGCETKGATLAKGSCVDGVLGHYFETQQALASDDLASAQAAAKEVIDYADKGKFAASGKGCCSEVLDAANTIASTDSIDTARASFQTLSNILISNVEEKGVSAASGSVYLMSCPMAFDNKGGQWLQSSAKVKNPYFGASMLSCGMQKASFGETAAKCEKDCESEKCAKTTAAMEDHAGHSHS